jgi:hypothetical protein
MASLSARHRSVLADLEPHEEQREDHPNRRYDFSSAR